MKEQVSPVAIVVAIVVVIVVIGFIGMKLMGPDKSGSAPSPNAPKEMTAEQKIQYDNRPQGGNVGRPGASSSSSAGYPFGGGSSAGGR